MMEWGARRREWAISRQGIPLVELDMGLTENASQSADGYLGFPGNVRRINSLFQRASKLDVTSPLANFEKPMDSSHRLTSRYGSGLSRPNLDLDGSKHGRPSRLRRLEVEF
jgi:hypothetical protein